MRYKLFLALFLLSHNIWAQISQDIYVTGVSEPVLSLNGTWSICLNPAGKFWGEDQLTNVWHDIQVPGEAMMQGYSIRHDVPFVYKKAFKVPSDFKEKVIKIRFEGVYSYAKVWINGTYIRDHHGGFTAWDCDISSSVIPGDTAILTIEITDRADEISYASGYAKHPIGGILRNVSLLALPPGFLEDITIKTNLDENYQHATLVVTGKTYKSSVHTGIKLELYDYKNKGVTLEHTFLELKNKRTFKIVNHINHPDKWDAEHPNLYSLKISLIESDLLQWQKVYKFGFREILIDKNKLLVNGKEVKLRGACRHDIHPLLGRVSTRDYELKDVMLAKESNMNFIRTSHYPPSDHFLKLCDEFGLYVEDETAVCFVGTHRNEPYRPGSTESDSDFTQRYLSQLKEMVMNHKNHPSVIIWSIGNENLYGTNFKKSFEWVKGNDDTRPVVFSYPGHVPDSITSYEILSMHYPDTHGNMDQYGKKTDEFGYEKMPVLFDEWAHVACYNHFTVREDPNIRDFWGRSLDMMWQKVFEADGGLGGAIWGMIDETFMLPEDLSVLNDRGTTADQNMVPEDYINPTVGYGEWGIVDTWRRKKPEFWNTKKAYSPVRLLQTDFEKYEKDKSLSVPLYNRFDHTNLNELVIKLVYKGQEKTMDAPNIEPHAKGYLTIPINDWDPLEPIILEFYDWNNRLIDKYVLRNKYSDIDGDESVSIQSIQFEERQNWLYVICEKNTRIVFNKKTGLLHEIQKLSDTISVSGPFLNLRTKGKTIRNTYNEINDHTQNWILKDFDYRQADQHVIINVKGNYDFNLPVEFNIRVNSNGKVKVQYEVYNIPEEFIREIGIKFELEEAMDSLSWTRKGYWSFYPMDHLSSETGAAALSTVNPQKYRSYPGLDWNLDAWSFYYDGTKSEPFNSNLSYLARSTKENVLEYKFLKNKRSQFSVLGEGQISCRVAENNNKFLLYINNEMDYIDLAWGNYQKNIILNRKYTNEVILSF
jgi:hypothetical protein